MVYTVHYNFGGVFWFFFTHAHYRDSLAFLDFGKENQKIWIMREERAKGRAQRRSSSIEISYMHGQNTRMDITHLSPFSSRNLALPQ